MSSQAGKTGVKKFYKQRIGSMLTAKRKCPVCGHEFVPHNVNQICCSHRCINVLVQRRWALRHKGEIPKCWIWTECAYSKCHKKFRAKRIRGKKYCCSKHRILALAERRREQFAKQRDSALKRRPLTNYDIRTVRYVMSLPAESRFPLMKDWTYEMVELAKSIYLNESRFGLI